MLFVYINMLHVALCVLLGLMTSGCFIVICCLTGQNKTKPLRVLISTYETMDGWNLEMIRWWSARARCVFTNSPSMFRAATSPSNQSCTQVSHETVLLASAMCGWCTRMYVCPVLTCSENSQLCLLFFSDDEITLFYNKNNTMITEWSRETMQTQYEWLFVSMSVTSKTVKHFGFSQTMIVYTVSIYGPVHRWKILY